MALVELSGSRDVIYTVNGLTGKRIFLCDWSERYAVAPKIGDPFPDLIGLYVSNVSLVPFGKNVSTGGHEKCKISVDYSSAKTGQQDGEVFKESIEFGNEMLTQGGGQFSPSGDDAPADVLRGTYFPELVLTFTKVVGDINKFVRLIRRKITKVNSTGWKGGKKEHWLFNGASASDFVNSSGAKRWRVTFKFMYRTMCSWNEDWNVNHNDGARFEEVLYVNPKTGAYTNKRYERTSFRQFGL